MDTDWRDIPESYHNYQDMNSVRTVTFLESLDSLCCNRMKYMKDNNWMDIHCHMNLNMNLNRCFSYSNVQI